MFGWTFDVDHLKSVVPGWVTMKPLTAACRIFCGVSLWLQARIGFESGSPGTPGAGRLAVAAEEAAPGGG